jgi:hypothetical protein
MATRKRRTKKETPASRFLSKVRTMGKWVDNSARTLSGPGPWTWDGDGVTYVIEYRPSSGRLSSPTRRTFRTYYRRYVGDRSSGKFPAYGDTMSNEFTSLAAAKKVVPAQEKRRAESFKKHFLASEKKAKRLLAAQARRSKKKFGVRNPYHSSDIM